MRESSASEQPAKTLDEHFFLSLPPSAVPKVREFLNSGNVDISFNFVDNRNATIYVSQLVIPAVLVDLPCISETFKAHDNRQFYKLCDCSKMLLGLESDDKFSVEQKVSLLKDANYRWPSGLSPPLFNCRNTRFRRPRFDRDKLQAIEAAVDDICKRDRHAISTEYRLVSMVPQMETENKYSEELRRELSEILPMAASPSQSNTQEANIATDLSALSEEIKAKQKEIDEAKNPIMKQRIQSKIAELMAKRSEIALQFAQQQSNLG